MKINYIHTEAIHNTNAAAEVLPYLFSIIDPKTVVDFGCGTGSWLSVAKDLGVNKILGIDGIHVEKNLLRISEDVFLQHNLTKPLHLNEKFDLALCLEVAEHLPETAADNVIDLLTENSDVVLFAAAIPGQGGQAHINEQWPEYWRQKFSERNFMAYDVLRLHFWENSQVDWWYKQNMFLYIKKGAKPEIDFIPIDKLTSLIHPELLELKNKIVSDSEMLIKGLESIIESEITHPKFYSSFKRLVKSIIR